MNQQDRQLLESIRDEIRSTLAASVESSPVLTDHESLEDISFMLQRTLNTLEHEIVKLSRH